MLELQYFLRLKCVRFLSPKLSKTALGTYAGTPVLFETPRSKDPQIQPDVANTPASTVATVNKNSDSVQCPALSVETTPSVAPCCGSDASSRGSPVANRTRGNLQTILIRTCCGY